MIIVENTPANRSVQQAVANLALSGMYVDEAFIRKLLQVANGELSSDDVIAELIQKYTVKE